MGLHGLDFWFSGLRKENLLFFIRHNFLMAFSVPAVSADDFCFLELLFSGILDGLGDTARPILKRQSSLGFTNAKARAIK